MENVINMYKSSDDRRKLELYNCIPPELPKSTCGPCEFVLSAQLFLPTVDVKL